MFKQLLDARAASHRQRDYERRELLRILGKHSTEERQVERFECDMADTATSLPADISRFSHHAA